MSLALFDIADSHIATGTCAVELALAKGAVYDIASGDLLEQAALRLIDQCQVDSTTTQGGIASRLGEHIHDNKCTYFLP